MKEKWKNTEIEGIKISNFGNLKVRSDLKFCENRLNDYKIINVFQKMYYIHRLVAKAFVKNPYNKPCVNHKDGNKLNNNAKNLEWVTHSENNKHAYRNGLKKPATQTNKHKAIYMLNDKKEIICIFTKIKYADIIFNKKISGNVIRAIKTNTKCTGYYWEYVKE